MSYIQLTTPLILFADPVLPEHAVTKQYVDTKKSNVNASWFTSGVMDVAVMPALSGDVISAAGSGTAVLSATGVTAGSYSKVGVSSSGRVVNGGSLTANDVPNVGWNKITGGKPTTAGGYGITNLIALSGGSSSGAVASTSSPSGSLHAVTKGYVDNAVVGVVSGVLNVGDVVRKPLSVAPTGFLRCNGGLADKVTYSNLFGVIGYSLYLTVTLDYVSSGAVGAGQPWRQQYDFNTTQSGDITGWARATDLPATIVGTQVVVTKNRVYLLGGNNSYSVYTAPINTDGTLGGWSIGTSLPITVAKSSAVVTKNRVYLLGGEINNVAYTSVYTAPINSDGTLGVWTTTGPSLVYSAISPQAFVTKSRVYLLGGRVGDTGTYSSSVQTAPINADGTLGTWTTSTSLPGTVAYSQSVATKNRVYLLGGLIDGAASSVVYTAPINTDGSLGVWGTGLSIPGILYKSHSVVTKNRVYLLGGQDVNGSVYTAPIGVDGAIGVWDASSVHHLPFGLTDSQVIITKNRIHLIGGSITVDGTTPQYSGIAVYTAPISGGLNDYSYLYDGSVNKFDGSDTTDTVIIGEQVDTTTNYVMPGSGQPWRQQYDINTTQSGDISGWTTGASLPVTLIDSQAVVTKSRIYLLGGIVNGSYSAAVWTTIINTDGTLGTWVSGVSLPNTVVESQAIVTKNRVYLLGGYIAGGSYNSTIYTAPINTDGTLGTWGTGGYITGPLYKSQAIVTKNRVYLLGGYADGTESSVVYTAPINTDGTIGTWTTGASLPATVYLSQAVVTKNRVYLLGGQVNTVASSVVFTATINTDGTLGTWTTGTPLPGGLLMSQAIVTKNRVYLLGGHNTTTGHTSTVYSALINLDGTLGAWSTFTALPYAVRESQAVTANSRVYLLGGSVQNGASAGVITATISGGLNDYSPYYDGTIQPVDTQSSINYQMPGSGRPWEQQYDVNTTQSGDITGWAGSDVLPEFMAFAQTLVTKNRVYSIGGVVGSSWYNKVYTAAINTDGTLGSWSLTTPLPVAIGYAQTITTKNRVYLLGGLLGGATSTNSVYSAVINSDGTLGAWTEGTPLPASVNYSQSLVTKNRVYLLGGVVNDVLSSTVYTAPINTDGTLGAWTTGSSLPATFYQSHVAVTKNRVYLLGGYINGSLSTLTTYTAIINTDGTLGNWTADSSLPGGKLGGRVMVTRNYVYIMGGANPGNPVSTVYTSAINTDGTLGPWNTGAPLYEQCLGGQLFVTKNRVYLCGGQGSGASYTTTVRVAPISGGLNDYSPYYDGTIQPASNTAFKLPDFTAAETSGLNYFIKY